VKSVFWFAVLEKYLLFVGILSTNNAKGNFFKNGFNMVYFFLRVSIKKKRLKRKVRQGVVHIRSTYNNTLVTVRTMQGRVLAWSSSGACGFRGARKSTPFAAKAAAEKVSNICLKRGLREVHIYVWGPGPGREAAIRRVYERGLRVTLIFDGTSTPHNGCRAPKRRRILLI
jgi:small subunit ribosomal protein S11